MFSISYSEGIHLSANQMQWLDDVTASADFVRVVQPSLDLTAILPDPHTAWLLPLDQCPVTLPESFAVAALSPREDAGMGLCIPASLQDVTQVPPFRQGSELAVEDELWLAYIQELRPDVVVGKSRAAIQVCRQQACMWVAAEDKFMPLSSLEFPPRAGSGILAIIVNRTATELRNVLALHHRKEVSRLSNIERSLQQRFVSKGIQLCGVHADEVEERNIRLSMAWRVPGEEAISRLVLYSSSHLGLVDLAWDKTGLPK